MSRIILVAVWVLRDLHPLVAIALPLQQRDYMEFTLDISPLYCIFTTLVWGRMSIDATTRFTNRLMDEDVS